MNLSKTMILSRWKNTQQNHVHISWGILRWLSALLTHWRYCSLALNHRLLVTPCLLTWIKEFIHMQHSNTMLDLRPHVWISVLSVDKFLYGHQQTRGSEFIPCSNIWNWSKVLKSCWKLNKAMWRQRWHHLSTWQDEVFIPWPGQTQRPRKANIKFKSNAQTSSVMEKTGYITDRLPLVCHRKIIAIRKLTQQLH